VGDFLRDAFGGGGVSFSFNLDASISFFWKFILEMFDWILFYRFSSLNANQ
jgi:hypothetical protein